MVEYAFHPAGPEITVSDQIEVASRAGSRPGKIQFKNALKKQAEPIKKPMISYSAAFNSRK
jgi:hypothetical protein